MSKYRAKNTKNGIWASDVIPNVLPPVALTGVATTSGSNEITVADTNGVFPGMGLAIAGIPRGAFVQAKKSGTVLLASMPSQDATTGEWSITAANATATATDMMGLALGANPVPIPLALTTGEGWRNSIPNTLKTSTLKVKTDAGAGTFSYADPGIMAGGVVPKEDAVFTTIHDATPIPLVAADKLTLAVGDEMLRKPHRTKSTTAHFFHLICTAGDVSLIAAGPNIALQRIGADD